MNVRAAAASRPTIILAAIAALALSMMYLIRPVLANDLHQADQLPIGWDSQSFLPGADDCDNAGLKPGEVLWHFVHTKTGDGDLPSTLDASFETAGPLTADGYVNDSSIVMYNIITGHDTLNSASDSINNDGLLNLSHICVGPPEQSVAESVQESVAQSVAESQAESVTESTAQSGEQSVEAGTGTPAGSQSDTAMGLGGGNPLPTIAFGLILLASLSGLAFVNVKAARKHN